MIRVLRGDHPEEIAALQRSLEAAPSYWMRVSAQLPKPSAAKEVFDALPEGKSYKDVLPFWKSLGFVETGIRRPYEDNGVVSETLVLEKAIR